MIPAVEKAIFKSDLGLNPITAGEVHPYSDAHADRGNPQGLYPAGALGSGDRPCLGAQRAARCHGQLKDLVKEKDISEDEERGAQDEVQKLTDGFVAKIEKLLAAERSRPDGNIALASAFMTISPSRLYRPVMPRHVAIIMDGNNRWAKRAGCIRVHRDIAQAWKQCAASCAPAKRHGVEVLTLFAFSSENWERPSAEVRRCWSCSRLSAQ